VVVGAEAQTPHLVLDAGQAGEDEDWGRYLGDAERLQDLVSGHVRQVKVEKDNVVVIELAEVDALLAQVRGVDVKPLGLEHQLDALRCCAVVLDQQNSHVLPLPSPAPLPASRRDWPPSLRAKSSLGNYLPKVNKP